MIFLNEGGLYGAIEYIIMSVDSKGTDKPDSLLALPVTAIIFGIIGIAFSAMAFHRMVASDLNN